MFTNRYITYGCLRFKGQIPKLAGSPIVRIIRQLGEIAGVIFRESGVGARSPECVCVWFGKESRDRKISGRYLTNREVFSYFKETAIAKSRKLRAPIERHCAALDFADQMKESDAGQFRRIFAKFVRTIDELPNTDPPTNNLGKRMFTITLG